jgi:hypothetical protein
MLNEFIRDCDEPEIGRTESMDDTELSELSDICNIVSMLRDLQEAYFGRLACGKQTEEQVNKSLGLVARLENMGYPEEEYLQYLAKRSFILTRSELIHLACDMYGNRKAILLNPYYDW